MSNDLLHKYVSIDTLKKIVGGSIRMTQPGAFNDPFELLPEIVTRPGQSEGTISFSFDILAPRRERSLEAVVQLTDGQVVSDNASRHILDELNQLIGILCLSRSPNSILMWSHYADQYQGAVVSFNADHEFFAGQIPVEYVEERPKKHLGAYQDSPVPFAELCAKSLEWQYEHEVRIARTLQSCNKTTGIDPRGFPVFTRDIPQEAIVTVALGERTPVAQQREIYQLLRNTSIGLTLSAVANNGYGFRQEVVMYPGKLRNPTVSPRTAHIFSDTESPLGEMARWMIANHPASGVVNKTV